MERKFVRRTPAELASDEETRRLLAEELPEIAARDQVHRKLREVLETVQALIDCAERQEVPPQGLIEKAKRLSSPETVDR